MASSPANRQRERPNAAHGHQCSARQDAQAAGATFWQPSLAGQRVAAVKSGEPAREERAEAAAVFVRSPRSTTALRKSGAEYCCRSATSPWASPGTGRPAWPSHARRLAVTRLSLHEQVRPRTIGSRYRDLLAEKAAGNQKRRALVLWSTVTENVAALIAERLDARLRLAGRQPNGRFRQAGFSAR
jgi:hypothetical protein